MSSVVDNTEKRTEQGVTGYSNCNVTPKCNITEECNVVGYHEVDLRLSE